VERVQAVDALETENKRLTEQHSQELKTLEQTAEEKQKQLVEFHHSTVQDLTNHHQQDLLAARQQTEHQLANLQQVVCHVSFYRKLFKYFKSNC